MNACFGRPTGLVTQFTISLAQGMTLTESADIDATNLAGKDTLTINGDNAVLDGANSHRGLPSFPRRVKSSSRKLLTGKDGGLIDQSLVDGLHNFIRLCF
jgi:hypothetical protein